jgi:DNA-binding NarL/FixJ family response regulator
MASPQTALDLGRSAYQERRWGDASTHFETAHREGGLPAADLERSATAAILAGNPAGGIDALTRAHEEYLLMGDLPGAVRCAGWLGMHLLHHGQAAQSSGWLARAGRLMAEVDDPAAVEGLLLIPAALAKLYGGDLDGAAGLFEQAHRIGARCRDKDVTSLAQLGQGQAELMRGRTAEGLGLFDEAMVAVTAGELSPLVCGIIYCETIGTCQAVFDLPRALEWTAALDRWCAGQPELVLFSGQCHSHRAELYVLRGQWQDALAAAAIALERSARGDPQGTFGGFYQQGEVHRLRGDFDAAETSYRAAGHSGFDPQPGMALLQLSLGDAPRACRQIRSAVDAADPTGRSRLLPALVEIELAAGGIAEARAAADELAALAADFPALMLRALAAQADGAVLLAEGRAGEAVNQLRRAWTIWRTLEIPFEAARCRALVARAHRMLGDEEAALADLDAARNEFSALGARPAVADIDSLRGRNGAVSEAGAAGPLTGREAEVLRLVAAGLGNRAVAVELCLSEKTVARHLSNIFLKLDVSSRVAASRYAYEHGLMT